MPIQAPRTGGGSGDSPASPTASPSTARRIVSSFRSAPQPHRAAIPHCRGIPAGDHQALRGTRAGARSTTATEFSLSRSSRKTREFPFGRRNFVWLLRQIGSKHLRHIAPPQPTAQPFMPTRPERRPAADGGDAGGRHSAQERKWSDLF
jgi:hypothetical protein